MNVSRVNEHAQKIKNIKKTFRDAYPPHLWKKGTNIIYLFSHITQQKCGIRFNSQSLKALPRYPPF